MWFFCLGCGGSNICSSCAPSQCVKDNKSAKCSDLCVECQGEDTYSTNCPNSKYAFEAKYYDSCLQIEGGCYDTFDYIACQKCDL